MSNTQHLRVATAPEENGLLHDPIRPAGTIVMTPAEWTHVKDNPRQRDTEKHARKARHLRKPHPTHRKVQMAILPDGYRVKIDGHTRDHLWSKGEVKPPNTLLVEVWECDALEDACELYSTFDNAGAVETLSDKMFGAFREMGLEYSSHLLASQRFGNAMRVSYEFLFGRNIALQTDVYDLLRYWRPELRLLDTCEPTRSRFPSGVHAGSLITLRRYGPKAVPFWASYAKGLGNKSGEQRDAVHALEDRVAKSRAQGVLNGRDNCLILTGVCISAVESSLRDQSYTHAIKATRSDALLKWFRRAKTTQRTW